MVISISEVAIPLKVDKSGVVRVGGTRVTLDTVVIAFKEGATAEEIMQQYPTLKLGDIYYAIAYYLDHQPEVEEYLRQREEHADRVRRYIASPVDLQELRDRMAARQNKERENT
jgi:uncharacterized protein (DUF433 family)